MSFQAPLLLSLVYLLFCILLLSLYCICEMVPGVSLMPEVVVLTILRWSAVGPGG